MKTPNDLAILVGVLRILDQPKDFELIELAHDAVNLK